VDGCRFADNFWDDFQLPFFMQFLKNIFAFLTFIVLLSKCVSHDLGDPDLLESTDASLFDEATDNGFVYFQGGNTLSKANESPHGNFKLRFNSIATSVLKGGDLPLGRSFPVGSVIVKEVYQNSTLAVLAVMKKIPTDPSAGSGWLWAEYQLSGVSLVSIKSKGNGCINCHSATPNRDLVRTFDLH
jgi:hypothetical protein